MERGMRIATRGSKLALAQADIISSLLRDNGILTEKITVKSQGDVDVSSPIYESKEQGVFVRKLNEQVIDGYADAAVHSAKDMPYEIDPDLEVSFFSKR
jgi:porphobilinogen deaminase